MPESPEELYARIVAMVGEDGRLPTSDIQAETIFPWEVVDGELVTKVFQPPLEAEMLREGEDPERPCKVCAGTVKAPRIWENDRFFISRFSQVGGLPLILFLQTKEHLDYPEMDDDLAGECGRWSARLCRIVEHLPHIGRVHVVRWGDGNDHMHLWFIARTERFAQMRGSFAVEWDEILPPPPDDVLAADFAAVARQLATHDGKALV